METSLKNVPRFVFNPNELGEHPMWMWHTVITIKDHQMAEWVLDATCQQFFQKNFFSHKESYIKHRVAVCSPPMDLRLRRAGDEDMTQRGTESIDGGAFNGVELDIDSHGHSQMCMDWLLSGIDLALQRLGMRAAAAGGVDDLLQLPNSQFRDGRDRLLSQVEAYFFAEVTKARMAGLGRLFPAEDGWAGITATPEEVELYQHAWLTDDEYDSCRGSEDALWELWEEKLKEAKLKQENAKLGREIA